MTLARVKHSHMDIETEGQHGFCHLWRSNDSKYIF